MKKLRYEILLGLLLALSGCGTVMSKYDTPKFITVTSEENFEIRRYEPALMAMTRTSTDNSGFREIFNFISGENSTKENIAMTIPVRTSSTEKASSSSMAFFMPHKYEASTLPKPKSETVEIREFPGGLFAAVRFSGTTSAAKVARKRQELISWLVSKGYTAGEKWYLDRYDPPWTLWFNRTNEVVIELNDRDGGS